MPGRPDSAFANRPIYDAAVRTDGADPTSDTSDVLHEGGSLGLGAVETSLCFWSSKEPNAKGYGENREDNGPHNPILRYVRMTNNNGMKKPRFQKR